MKIVRKNSIKILFLLLLHFPVQFFAQDAKIIGKVYDGSSGDVLSDAVIRVEPINKGAASDLEGKYSLNNIKPGSYTIKASYVGYNTQTIKASIKPEEMLIVDFILKPESVSVDTLTIEAERKTNNEAGLLLQQQKSERISDGISSQQIKRSDDSYSSDVLKRVIGISIVQDKFVFVRGTSERYSNALLNGSYLPSTESDKKSFSFDIFPSNLLDNMVVYKTNTPDQPADFTGGLININTIDFPDKLTFSLSFNPSYNSQTTGEGFTKYEAGQKTLGTINLGLDDGGRQLPSVIPNNKVTVNSFSLEELQTFGRSFRNNWQQFSESAPINGGFNFSAGTSVNLLDNPFGVIGSFSYKNVFNNKQVEELEILEFSPTNDTLSYFKSNVSEYSVNIGSLLNFNYMIGNANKISLKNSFTLSSDDETVEKNGFYNPEIYDRIFYNTKFTERIMFSTVLLGEHYLHNVGKMRVSWKLNYGESERDEPDFKKLMYQRDRGTENQFYAPFPTGSTTGNETVGGRFFSDMYEYNRGFGIDIELPVDFIRPIKSSKIKVGLLANTSNRDYRARSFSPVMSNNAPFEIIYEGPDSLLREENITPERLTYVEITGTQDKYIASQQLYAGYLMVDIPYKKFRLVAGARLENHWQKLNGFDLLGKNVTVSLLNNDLLPSANLTYQLTDKMNLRAAYSVTVSRPELREIAPTVYVDWSNFTTTVGNPDSLDRTLIHNYDIRFEAFPEAGEILSLSLFYKHFDAPIEESFLPRTGSEKLRSFFNATAGAKNYGVELEARKKLGFISKYLKDFAFLANVTFVQSQVSLDGVTNVATDKTRRMQGQSPYMLNLGLLYDNFESGTSVNLLFNRIGERISEVGLQGTQSIYENGRPVLDFTVTQKLFKYVELKFAAKDILNEDIVYTQLVNNAEQVVKRYNGGSNYALILSIKY